MMNRAWGLTYRRGERRPDLKKDEIHKILLDENLFCSNDCENDHDKAQAEDTHQACLLFQGYLQIVDQLDRHGHHWRYCQHPSQLSSQVHLLHKSVKMSIAVL